MSPSVRWPTSFSSRSRLRAGRCRDRQRPMPARRRPTRLDGNDGWSLGRDDPRHHGCVEIRFGGPRAPHRVQWLSDNGSIYVAIVIALALNLDPWFTPVESPESNGMAEVFVKKSKRGYVRVKPIEDTEAALTSCVFGWPTTPMSFAQAAGIPLAAGSRVGAFMS